MGSVRSTEIAPVILIADGLNADGQLLGNYQRGLRYSIGVPWVPGFKIAGNKIGGCHTASPSLERSSSLPIVVTESR